MIVTRERSALVILLGVLCMAPTVGDVGGCGKTVTALDPTVYADARKVEDCRRCTECGITTARCARACDGGAPPDIEVPATCQPLQHDGEVCLRALSAASCSTYETYVDDNAPATPSECEFCKAEPVAAPSAKFALDAGPITEDAGDAGIHDGGAP